MSRCTINVFWTQLKLAIRRYILKSSMDLILEMLNISHALLNVKWLYIKLLAIKKSRIKQLNQCSRLFPNHFASTMSRNSSFVSVHGMCTGTNSSPQRAISFEDINRSINEVISQDLIHCGVRLWHQGWLILWWRFCARITHTPQKLYRSSSRWQSQ